MPGWRQISPDHPRQHGVISKHILAPLWALVQGGVTVSRNGMTHAPKGCPLLMPTGGRTSGQKFASVEAVENHLDEWTDDTLRCRVNAHTWLPAEAAHYRELRYIYTRESCHCGCKRHTEMSERGAILARWIEYAEGYLLEGEGRVAGEAKDVIRLASLQRTFPLKISRNVAQRPRSMHTREAIGWRDAAPSKGATHGD